MEMVHMSKGQKSMQRGIDGGRCGVVTKGAKRVHADHLVFQLNAAIDPRECEHLIEVQGGKAFYLDAAQVATATLYPEYGLLLPIQRIGPLEFRAGVAAAEVGDAQIGSEQVGAIAQKSGRVEGFGMALIPKIGEIVQGHTSSPCAAVYTLGAWF
jgi:hypothetical protein